MKTAPRASEAADEKLVCTTCGRMPDPSDEATARLTWSRGTDAGHSQWTCDGCSRDHLRSIEGKLDPAWW